MNWKQEISTELDSKAYDAIVALCADGDTLAHTKDYQGAIAKYEQAWNLLPEPKTKWEAAAWILAAIGDARFFSGDFARSLDVFTYAITNCSGALGNPFLHLRRGESLFELDRRTEAADELMRAYMGGERAIFNSEDPKYIRFLETVAKL